MATAIAVGLLAAPASAPAAEPSLPPGFGLEIAFNGLTNPTAVEFAPDGRIFVAEKSGLIKVFDGLEDTTATTVADLRTQVHNFWDRGLLDIALDPEFLETPYIYALYTHDAEPGGVAPRWGSPGVSSDPCPTPPGPTTDGCLVGGRLSKLPLEGSTAGPEQVLIEDWCSQYPSHSVGAIDFDSDGALYVSGGEGASFTFTDYGQKGDPPNPCGDPPDGRGTALSPPDAEGGALRSQDIRTPADPTGLAGSVIRIDRSDGAALPDNPNFGASDPNARRIIGYGLRNPFRLAVRPGTDEVWLGDVGANAYEELNRQGSGELVNHGWPCHEGPGRQAGFDTADLDLCESLYAAGSARGPFFSYAHDDTVVDGEVCRTGSSSVSGLAFYEGGPFPAAYDDALIFADYSRDCIWAMKADASGAPDPSQTETLVGDAINPVNLVLGTDGSIYYPDFDHGTIRAIRYFAANQPPSAAISASPRSGDAPLEVSFDGSGSSDPDSTAALSYEWDLDGDGAFDDSTAVAPTHTYTTAGTHLVKLRVTDGDGGSGTAQTSIEVDNTPPVATIDSPASTLEWAVGEQISFSGSATDAEQGDLDPAALDWQLILHHCPSNCHTHSVQSFEDIAGGEFAAPDHEYPSHLELVLTATDESGLSDTASVELQPRTAELTLASDPPGAELSLNATSAAAPFSADVIVGSSNSIGAPESFQQGGIDYTFESWQHGGARSQNVVAPEAGATYTAVYEAAETDTFAPIADASIYEDDAGANFGTSPSLDALGAPRRDFLLKFDVSGIGSEGVESAKLRLHATDPGPLGGFFHETTNGWTEEGVAWANAPPRGNKFATLGGVTAGEWYEIDVGSVVSGEGVYSFRVATDKFNGVSYSSRDGDPALAPQLIVASSGEPPPPDTTPPTVPTGLTGGINADGDAELAWDPASDDDRVSEYAVFRDGLEMATTPTPGFVDDTVELDEEYEYRVAARDPSGNESGLSDPVTVSTPASAPVSQSFAPAADASIYEDDAGANFGASPSLEALGAPRRDFLLKFDVSGAGTEVIGATLRLHATDPGPLGGFFHRTTNAWTEGGVTWSNAPGRGERFATLGRVRSGEWYEVDVSPVVTGNGTYSFRVASDKFNGVSYASREGDPALRPELVVTSSGAPPPPPPPPSEAPVIGAAGDIACDPGAPAFNGGLGTATECRQMHTSDLLVDLAPDAVLPLGDTQYDDGTLAKFDASYDPSWGRLKAITRPAIGNHEYRDPAGGAQGYFDYFNGPGEQTGPAGDRSEGYYSYDLDNWHVVALNSNCAEIGGCGAGSPQEQWLRADLEASQASCVLAYMHHPLFTSGARGGRTAVRPLWRVLYDFGADVMLVGHEHHYERFARQDPDGNADPSAGIRQFVVGTGGENLVPAAGPTAANSGVREGGTFGAIKMTLEADTYQWEYLDEAGSFTDAGTDFCDAPTQDTEPPSVPANLTADLDADEHAALSWDPATDNDGVSAYAVFRDGAEIGTTRSPGYVDSTVTPGQTHTYRVAARDPSGNESGRSDPVDLTIPGGEPTSGEFVAVADASLYSESPDQNLGSAQSLETDGLPRKDFVVRFDVSGLGSEPVSSATLRLRAVDPSPSGGDVGVIDDGWSEGGVTWNNAPAPQPPIASFGEVVAGQSYEVDVTNAIDGNGTFSFRVSSANSNGADYASREASSLPAPRLIVETGEEPPPPETLTIEPDRDASIYEDAPSANFGAAASLDALGAPRRDFLLGFEVSGVGSAPINEARLRLHATDPGPLGGFFHETTNGWTEGGVNWSNAPGRGATFATLGSVAADTWYDVDVSPVVSGDGTYSFRVATDKFNGVSYSSREGPTSLAPHLFLDVSSPTLTAATRAGVEATVLRVRDARTVRVRVADDGRIDVRLLGVKAAGRRTCLGRKAHRALRRRLDRGDRVRLLADPRGAETDRRGRFLRYIETGSGDVGGWLIARGRAKAAGSERLERAPLYAEAQDAAKQRARKLKRSCRRRGRGA